MNSASGDNGRMHSRAAVCYPSGVAIHRSAGTRAGLDGRLGCNSWRRLDARPMEASRASLVGQAALPGAGPSCCTGIGALVVSQRQGGLQAAPRARITTAFHGRRVMGRLPNLQRFCKAAATIDAAAAPQLPQLPALQRVARARLELPGIDRGAHHHFAATTPGLWIARVQQLVVGAAGSGHQHRPGAPRGTKYPGRAAVWVRARSAFGIAAECAALSRPSRAAA